MKYIVFVVLFLIFINYTTVSKSKTRPTKQAPKIKNVVTKLNVRNRSILEKLRVLVHSSEFESEDSPLKCIIEVSKPEIEIFKSRRNISKYINSPDLKKLLIKYAECISCYTEIILNTSDEQLEATDLKRIVESFRENFIQYTGFVKRLKSQFEMM
ncbi:077L [Cherax quadricarinatus iridovirus]|uniref:Uncharacterized protein n=1 Tax=Shrimp hemocyte iridescent virus TaxID=2039780 RepID=A0A291B0S3_9VIRU|nr:077L [Cherax quadricarinatus iridovirus]YP_010084827.1 hypothetical protein KM509_gp075 [Shrimp hemocyte iridescent virus]UPA43392.1 hypothetical protein 4TH000118 [Iridovirus CN01]ASZ85057.1 077L [Cherax quadricarinatus iridovirus]ATE87084.1 hypothetical protein [Shrimp hemocyte iridescent virus]UPA43468.1 hypothetical protein 3TG000035 [Iridovirus CN01]UPA43663.1 hypothetical protein 1DG000071 [Iridovirus CN01]